MSDNNDDRRGLFVILTTALLTLFVLSLLPWSDTTHNIFKDFNLFGDIMPHSDKTYITHEELDPELAALHEELSASVDTPDSTAASLPASVDNADTLAAVVPLHDDFVVPVAADGSVLIEDYSPDGSNLAALRESLAGASSRRCNIAVVGDSYIEGDIFTQDVRSLLQDSYGGCGVGYMAAFSQIPGFRQSVVQSGSGWTGVEIRDMKSEDPRILQGQYFVAESGATASFKGGRRPAHADSWDESLLMFVSPSDGTIKITGPDGAETSHPVAASSDVQCIITPGQTTRFSFSTDIDSLMVLGCWLRSTTGVQLDCMSLRGNSGISHRNLNASITGQMRSYVDYDLIVLEFGINALSSEQTDYSAYASAMTRVVNTVRVVYPNAIVMLLGIGDRGQKQGTEIGSIGTAPAMTRAQRDVARRTGALFWDTRAAMGGDGAAVDWHKRGLVNADYIHLNHKGGRELARIFVNSLKNSIEQ